MQSLNVGGETAKRSQLERVQRSSQIQHPSLVPSLSVGQLERVQRSSQIQHPSLVPSLVLFLSCHRGGLGGGANLEGGGAKKTRQVLKYW